MILIANLVVSNSIQYLSNFLDVGKIKWDFLHTLICLEKLDYSTVIVKFDNMYSQYFGYLGVSRI